MFEWLFVVFSECVDICLLFVMFDKRNISFIFIFGIFFIKESLIFEVGMILFLFVSIVILNIVDSYVFYIIIVFYFSEIFFFI